MDIQNKVKSHKAVIKEFAIYAVIVLTAFFVTRKYVGAGVIVEGSSMELTLQDRDRLIEEKISYYLREPERYDVVIIDSPVEPNKYWVKRIIGLPGETLQIIDGSIYVDGRLLEDENYGTGSIDYLGVLENPFTVPTGEYFLMGDNREGGESWDSRYSAIGTITRDKIEGRVICRIFPFDSVGKIK